jgi:hypothetical protein
MGDGPTWMAVIITAVVTGLAVWIWEAIVNAPIMEDHVEDWDLENETPEYVPDVTIELLAMKLYEHAHQGRWPPGTVLSWVAITREERHVFRSMAGGHSPLIGPRRRSQEA